MRKIVSLILALVMLLGVLGGCAKKDSTQSQTEETTEIEETKETTTTDEFPYVESSSVRLGALKGVTTMGMVKLLDDAENKQSANDYEFQMAATADELTGPFMQGKIDILAVPANLGSILYNKMQGKAQVLAINMLGGLFIVQKGEQTINAITDLKGKTIYATGSGNTPEYVLRYILQSNGMTLGEDVEVEWMDEPSEAVAQMSNEENAIAMLPQPFVVVAQTQLQGLNIVLNLEDEWNKNTPDIGYVTAVAIVRREFAEKNPDKVKTFLEEYRKSTEFVKTNTADAATLIEKYGIVKAAIAQKALPYCNICCITGSEMKTKLDGYLGILFITNQKSIGGKVPGDDFYYIDE